MNPPSTMQDLIDLQATDLAALNTDNQTLTADQAKVTADQSQIATDTATQSTDAASLQSALSQLPPPGAVASLSEDGKSVIPYAAPGVVIASGVPIPLASSVPIPAPDPTPATP